jgi:chemotaxis signal transduction protein
MPTDALAASAEGAVLRAGSATLKLVGFRIEHWRFAVRLAQVKTSLLPCPITRVFRTAPHVKGIISLHGAIVGVLDLGHLLGLRSSGAKFSRFIVLSDGGVEAAIPVHEVFRVPEVSTDRIEPVPVHVAPDNRVLLEGIINTSGLPSDAGEDTITLIDAAQLFDAPAIRALRGQA